MNIFIEPVFSDIYNKYPITLIDVGASGGLEPNWLPAEKYLQTIGFEPDKRAHSSLPQNERQKYLNVALGDKNTSLPFYLTKKQQTSSIYKPNYRFLKNFPDVDRFNIVEQTDLNTDTLDNSLKVNSILRADFIKLDTQGSELSILNGGKKILSNQKILFQENFSLNLDLSEPTESWVALSVDSMN